MTERLTFTFHFYALEKKWQPTPVFLPGESQGRWSLVGCRLWDCTESDTTESTQQQQQQHANTEALSQENMAGELKERVKKKQLKNVKIKEYKICLICLISVFKYKLKF